MSLVIGLLEHRLELRELPNTLKINSLFEQPIDDLLIALQSLTLYFMTVRNKHKNRSRLSTILRLHDKLSWETSQEVQWLSELASLLPESIKFSVLACERRRVSHQNARFSLVAALLRTV